MIDRLIEKYKKELNNIVATEKDNWKLNYIADIYQEILQDLKELKKQLNEAIMINWDESSYTDETLECKVAEINITELKNIVIGYDTK